MCLAIAGKVLKIKGKKATVDFDGIEKDINIQMIDAKIGDYVLVSMGFATKIIDKKVKERFFVFISPKKGNLISWGTTVSFSLCSKLSRQLQISCSIFLPVVLSL